MAKVKLAAEAPVYHMGLVLSLLLLPWPWLRLMNKQIDQFLGFCEGRRDGSKGNIESHNSLHDSSQIHTFYFNGVSKNFTPLERKNEFSWGLEDRRFFSPQLSR